MHFYRSLSGFHLLVDIIFQQCVPALGLDGKPPSNHALQIIVRSMFYDVSLLLFGFHNINCPYIGFYLLVDTIFTTVSQAMS